MELIPSQQTRKLSLKKINLCVQIGLEGYKKERTSSWVGRAGSVSKIERFVNTIKHIV